jgi:TonB family protein
VKIVIDQDTGRITSWEVTEPSGDPSYDAAAERSVEEAATLPLPPEKYRAVIAREGVGFVMTPQ